jgi:hypothetical protein
MKSLTLNLSSNPVSSNPVSSNPVSSNPVSSRLPMLRAERPVRNETSMKKGTQIVLAFPSDTRLGLGQKPFPNRGGSRHQA